MGEENVEDLRGGRGCSMVRIEEVVALLLGCEDDVIVGESGGVGTREEGNSVLYYM